MKTVPVAPVFVHPDEMTGFERRRARGPPEGLIGAERREERPTSHLCRQHKRTYTGGALTDDRWVEDDAGGRRIREHAVMSSQTRRCRCGVLAWKDATKKLAGRGSGVLDEWEEGLGV